MRTRSLVVLLLAVVAATSVAVAVAGNTFVVVAGGPRIERRIGSFHFLRDLGRYPAAVREFGRPSSRTAGTGRRDNLCVVRWARLGLRMEFAATPAGPCSDSALGRSAWAGATLDAGPWRTDRGLRLGDSLDRLRRVYPQASYRTGPAPAWLLLFVRGEVGTTVLLQAKVGGGRVTSLELPPPNVSVRR